VNVSEYNLELFDTQLKSRQKVVKSVIIAQEKRVMNGIQADRSEKGIT
jgi:hypothetical protein